MATELTIYQSDTGERIIAADTTDGREMASQVLYGSRADAEQAQPTGFAPDSLTPDQEAHLRRHGWAPVA